MTDRYAELRDALDAVKFIERDGRKLTVVPQEQWDDACHPEAIRALLAERDALRQALTEVLRVNETDAGNDVKTWASAMLNARAALSQVQGGSDGNH